MIKILRHFKKKAIIFCIIAIILVMAAAYFDATQPTFLQDALSGLSKIYRINQKDGDWKQYGWSDYWFPILKMALYAISSLICGVVGAILGSTASLYAQMDVRNAMFGKIQSFGFSEIDKFSTASLVTRTSTDTTIYQQNLQMILTIAFRTPITIGISIYNAFTPPMGKPIYGVIVICVVAFMITLGCAIGVPVLKTFSKAQVQLDNTNKVMRENILGARVVKAFNLQDLQHNHYDKASKELKRLNIKGQAALIPIMSIFQFALSCGVIIILMVGGYTFIKSDNHPPINAGIFAFAQLIAIVLFGTIMLVMVIVQTTRAVASIHRINDVLNTKTTLIEDKNPQSLVDKDNSVVFENVKFKYNKDANKYALEDVSFAIGTGQTLGIVGGTGSGKSTIANLIARFYDVDEGAILIGGVNVRHASFNDVFNKVSVVLQDALLFSGTIASNLKYGNANATIEDMEFATKSSCAFDFINQYPEKFEKQVEQRGRNFSGGQKQRISLARTLIKKPKILILDDTTSALDLLTEKQVRLNLAANYQDCTKIIISQRISAVKDADKIIVMDNGKVSGIGTHEELVANNDIYRLIVDSQLGAQEAE